MRVAILRDSFEPAVSYADPGRIAAALSDHYTVDILSADQFADPAVFNTENYSLVIMPYGPCFPAAARNNFLAFLRNGGDFLSTGGYAFDCPMIKWKGKWFSREQLLNAIPTREVDIGSEEDIHYLTGEWHNREQSPGEWEEPKGNKRWTGKSAGLRLTVEPDQRYTIEIWLGVNPRTASLKRRILLNGRRILDIPPDHHQKIKIQLEPKHFNGKSQAELVFDCELWRPIDLGENEDERSLGVAVSRVILTPEKPAEKPPDISILDHPINMRYGNPTDFLEWEEEQIGVFDAGFRLTGGCAIGPSKDQYIVPKEYHLKGKVQGWAAAGTTGSGWYWTTPTDRSRLISLLDVTDRYGRCRGSGGSLMINHLPPYRGSIWAFFGIENRDIFSEPGGERLLLNVVDALQRGVFLHDTRPSLSCYRDGEEAVIRANISNFGNANAESEVRFHIKDEKGNPVFYRSMKVEPAPEETKQVSVSWRPGMFDDDFYTVRVELLVDSKSCDCENTAFYVWKQDTLSNGFDLSYAGNYLRDSGRPRYMLGVEPFYPIKTVTGTNPLEVERDFREIADLGIHVARTFTRADTEEDCRFTDALVMAAQRHRVVFFLAQLAGINAYLNSPEEVSRKAADIIRRYKGVPGLMIDIQNEPNFQRGPDELRDKRFNAYLMKQYSSTADLRSAWGDELMEGEELGSVKMGWINDDWTSIRSRDIYRFLLDQGRTWTSGITKTVKLQDPDRLVSVGYLSWWAGMMMDPAATSDALDFINRHWYGKIDNISIFDAQFVMSDRRYRGKAPSVGEFGSKTHPTFALSGHNYDTEEQQEIRYLHIGHYAFALGGIFASNWHWRDPVSNVFPYGIAYSDHTLKPAAKAYRAMSLLFTGLRPKYIPPKVYLVLPDESRFGGGTNKVFQMIQRAANGLISSGIRFGTINEWDLARLPAEAELLVMPSPFAVSEDAYQKLKEFVFRGGVLYVSGDISFDENRKRTRTSRLEELAGISFLKENYPDIQAGLLPGTTVVYKDGLSYQGSPAFEFTVMEGTEVVAEAGGKPVAVERRCGQGRVLFSSDPIEFWEQSPLRDTYRKAAASAGIQPSQAKPDTPDIQVFRQPLESDGEIVILGNTTKKRARAAVVIQDREYSLDIGPMRQAVLVSQAGKLVGLEAQGDVFRDGRRLISARNHFFLLSLDTQDLACSTEAAFVALKPGRYELPCSGLRAEAGEVRNAKWVKLEELGYRDNILTIQEAQEGEIILLSPAEKTSKSTETIVRILCK